MSRSVIIIRNYLKRGAWINIFYTR